MDVRCTVPHCHMCADQAGSLGQSHRHQLAVDLNNNILGSGGVLLYVQASYWRACAAALSCDVALVVACSAALETVSGMEVAQQYTLNDQTRYSAWYSRQPTSDGPLPKRFWCVLL
jgi:hypothetical protein